MPDRLRRATAGDEHRLDGVDGTVRPDEVAGDAHRPLLASEAGRVAEVGDGGRS